MNSVQMHLALAHVHVILSLVGLVMLVIAFFYTKLYYYKSILHSDFDCRHCSLTCILHGESTEEAIGNLSGLSEAVIERHEEVAKSAMISIAAAGLVALTALFSFKWRTTSRVLRLSCYFCLSLPADLWHKQHTWVDKYVTQKLEVLHCRIVMETKE